MSNFTLRIIFCIIFLVIDCFELSKFNHFVEEMLPNERNNSHSLGAMVFVIILLVSLLLFPEPLND